MTRIGVVMIALVVFIHLPLVPEVPWCEWWRTWIRDGVCRVAVPWFYFAAGVHFARHVGEGDGWYGREVRKRVGSLLVPYYVLNVAWLPFMMACNWVGTRFFGQQMTVPMTWECAIRGLGLSPMAWPIVVPTWFLRSLFVVVVVAGLAYRSAGSGKCAKLAVALAAWTAFAAQRMLFPAWTDLWTYGLDLFGLALFASGVTLSEAFVARPSTSSPADARLRQWTWSVFVLHTPLLSVLYMPFKALGLLKSVFIHPFGYLAFWGVALVGSCLLGRFLRISRLRALSFGVRH